MGNIGSIVNMIKKVGGRAEVVRGPDDLLAAGSLFVFRGRRRAVLVKFPTRAELDAVRGPLAGRDQASKTV